MPQERTDGHFELAIEFVITQNRTEVIEQKAAIRAKLASGKVRKCVDYKQEVARVLLEANAMAVLAFVCYLHVKLVAVSLLCFGNLLFVDSLTLLIGL